MPRIKLKKALCNKIKLHRSITFAEKGKYGIGH
jgi:hypothetical protein